MTMTYLQKVDEAVGAVRARAGAVPDVAVVLGSGLGDFANQLTGATTVPYAELPHWPASKVIGHEGKLVIGMLGGKRVAALSGRAHFYEGHDLRTVTFATRAIARLGVKALILTNAAGGINTNLKPGTLMVMDDHINLLGSNPLVGPNEDAFGPRFPDMSEVYSKRLRGKRRWYCTRAGSQIHCDWKIDARRSSRNGRGWRATSTTSSRKASARFSCSCRRRNESARNCRRV